MTEPLAQPRAIHHVRLTVTDIGRSKGFYRSLLGLDPAIDTSDQAGEPGVSEDPARYYGGCVFDLGDQLLGLRPVADAGDRFSSTRVGLDHLSLAVGSRDELVAAAARLDEAGVEHGEVTDLTDAGLAILSLQDPDDINLELTAPLA
ncbi:VOC family protein [Modestobacter sp. VKM Ac-2986]|uniref:VOC family protein n=1 Tax=Modestobacter sp. VKM Ac-2986 TaxID=3004140 RepID=UPI0022ABA368|nr:VOC family protein [Modestobacter sp. VKM Ac-2986]MCZ2830320.1 VOC family protein [Modestobacter sp. VKM Ac-2986]